MVKIMLSFGVIVYFKYLLISFLNKWPVYGKEKLDGVVVDYDQSGTAIISTAYSITLNQSTSKPRFTKFSSSTLEPGAAGGPVVSPSPNTDDSGVAYYRLVNGRTDSTCLLLKTDAVVEVKFKLHGLQEQADSFIPSKALVEGNCKEEDTSSMRLSWNGYSLVIYFAKTPGGEIWYVSNLELTVSPNLAQLHGVQTQSKSIKLYHRQMLIPTPVGKSFKCHEVEVPMTTDKDDHPPPGLYGTLFLRLLQVQPFMYKSEDFSDSFECKSQMSFRDETAPIVVGSTLAVAVLVTITGYSVYRYMKVKNLQYNTME